MNSANNVNRPATLPPTPDSTVTLRDIRDDKTIQTYIEHANMQMAAIGYTEHGLRHAGVTAGISRNICLELGMDPRTAELAGIAGYMHDIGNCVHRAYHPQIGATMAYHMLDALGMPASEIALIIAAIGNHEEPEGEPINDLASAVIIADKSDVHRTRVQNPDAATFDIHDRVNFAVQRSHLNIHAPDRSLVLDLEIDTSIAPVIEYFEIFVARMVMCRKAADRLSCHFGVVVNGIQI